MHNDVKSIDRGQEHMFDVDDVAICDALRIKWSFCVCVLSIVLRLTERRALTYLAEKTKDDYMTHMAA